MSNRYEIICPEELSSSIQELINQKREKGYYVNIKYVHDFGDPINHDAIRNYILQVNPRYYLLVGDIDYISGYPLHEHYSDAFYGMDDNDNIPRIPFGRISSNDQDIVEAICHKIVSYQHLQQGQWTKNVILTGWLPRASTQLVTSEDAGWQCLEQIGDHYKVTKRLENNESASGEYNAIAREEWEVEGTDKSSLTSAIETGALVVRYLGHGGRGEWSNIGRKNATDNVDEKYTNSDIISLSNQKGMPFVFSAACLTGSIAPDISFSEQWQVSGKAIGVYAADVVTKTYWNDRITQELFHHLVRNRNLTIGELIIRSLETHFSKHGDRGDDYMKAYTAYRYFGDPDTVLLDLREDRIKFNTDNVRLIQVNGHWKITDGRMWLLDFESKRNEAELALRIINHYGLNRQCFVGRPGASMEYYLVGNNAPEGAMSNEDSIPFNPGDIEVKKVSNRWKILSGRLWLLDFGNSESEARTSYEIIRKYGFRYICFVGRPYPSMTYFRK